MDGWPLCLYKRKFYKKGGLFNISENKYDEFMEVLKKLCYSENEQIALKACIEMLERSEKKTTNKCFKWFVSEEKVGSDET